VVTADVAATYPEAQAAKKRKLVLRNLQNSSVPDSKELETIQPAPQNDISISDDEEAETIGLALTRKKC
jgi:hypothetical protein